MQNTQTHRFWLRVAQHVTLALVCMVVAFSFGINTAGEFHPFEEGQAAELVRPVPVKQGDVDQDGEVNVRDVIAILEVSEGLREPTAGEMERADMNDDVHITTEDALRLLRSLALRQL